MVKATLLLLFEYIYPKPLWAIRLVNSNSSLHMSQVSLWSEISYIFFFFLVEIGDAPILAAIEFDLPQRWYSTCLSTSYSFFFK